MAHIQVGVLMRDEIELNRPVSTPRQVHKKQPPPFRSNQFAKWLTFGVLVFAAAWEVGITLLHLHPSKLTFTGFLAVLIFYTGEFLDWRPPRPHKRKPRPAPWRSR
jgi:hypothetical protein